MNQPNTFRVTLDQIPRVSQDLKLRCTACGTKSVYDVGTIFCSSNTDSPSERSAFHFSNYFHCKSCGSAGPWEIADYMKMTALTLRSVVDKKFEGLQFGTCHLFDGTNSQSPAQSEQYLLGLIKAESHNAFLCTRLGNVLRGCGQQAKAAPWYQKAVKLDPGDIEARYHLLVFALEAKDATDAAASHARLLVRSLLDGRTTDREELTEGLAYWVVENLVHAEAPFRQSLLKACHEQSDHKQDIFIRTLLARELVTQEDMDQAAECLLDGQLLPSTDPIADDTSEPAPEELMPSLQQVVQCAGLDASKLCVAFETNGQHQVRVLDKHRVVVSDGQRAAPWTVPSLHELFRGNRTPPADMAHYPPEYTPHFFFIERQFLTLCDAMGDRTDQEMEEIYAALRRRPDGRSLGVAHDFVWQVLALLLGTRVLSESEFEALMGALLGSARKWAMRPISRNYVAYLRKTFEDAHSASCGYRVSAV